MKTTYRITEPGCPPVEVSTIHEVMDYMFDDGMFPHHDITIIETLHNGVVVTSSRYGPNDFPSFRNGNKHH